jgi:hypothetical protein
MLEQLAVILPRSRPTSRPVDFLLRGERPITGTDTSPSRQGLGAGTVDVLVEDARGVRTS